MKFLKNKEGNIAMVGAVVSLLIMLIISALVFYNVAGAIDTTTIDAGLTGTPSANATEEVLDQAAVFYAVAPILALVIVAVVILAYVKRIG